MTTLPGGNPEPARTGQPLRVLVVDDSATVRAVLARRLNESPQINVIGRAADGVEGVELVELLKPDVVTLDIEMPRLDGLGALREIMARCPTPVVMVSSLTKQGAEATLTALELGAVDFIEKPMHGSIPAPNEIADDVIEKVLQAGRARVRRGSIAAPSEPRPPAGPVSARNWLDRTVVIGSSTGGPQALRAVITELPAELGVPVVVVQHMPPEFTRSLARRLDELSAVRVIEARPGSKLEPGTVLLAPGAFHLVFDSRGVADLDEGPPELNVRPAVNVTMESIVKFRGDKTLGVVLTGMGRDGTRGAELIQAAGGTVLAQSEETCIVYGMPRSIVDAGLADEVIPLERMAAAIVRHCQVPAARRRAS